MKHPNTPISEYQVPDGEVHDMGFNGLASVSDEVKAELPPECLAAFEEALAKELEWKGKMGNRRD